MDSSNQTTSNILFTREEDLKKKLSTDIQHFWQLGIFDDFLGANNVRINFAIFLQANNKTAKNIVILPGRCEGYVKYKELCFDLFFQGYNLFIIDHRGQGISQRLLSNHQKGYVEDFELYSDDLHQFIKQKVNPYCTSKPYLLAHSMGSAIAVRYMQKHPNTINAAVLSSPMFAIYSAGLPKIILTALVWLLAKINQVFAKQPWYFFGQKDYSSEAFSQNFPTNQLTQSQIRYQITAELYKTQPELQLGGATIHWLLEALKTQSKIFKNLHKLTAPINVLQAGADKIVDNKTQDLFCQKLHALQKTSCPNGQAVIIEQARHELFFEKDSYRNQALTQAIAWFESH